MTLLEVLIAVAITSMVMSLAVSVVGSGVRLARQGEQTVNSNEAARTAMEMILRDLRAAGVPQGIWVTSPGGTPVRINSIFTRAGTGTADTGIDDLWLVVPRPAALQSNCQTPGSGAVVMSKTVGASALPVNCTNIFAEGDILLVSNYTTAAMITATGFASNNISYAQMGTTNFSSVPEKGGFLMGDQVFPVDIIRYQVRLNAGLATATFPLGRPELIRTRGHVKLGSLTANDPFEVIAGDPEQRFPDVEDLQVAFGTGVAPGLTFNSGHLVAFNGTAPLSARVSVVGITPRPILDDQHKIQPDFHPLVVDDHTPPSLADDGYRRSLYRRRVELLNVGVVNL